MFGLNYRRCKASQARTRSRRDLHVVVSKSAFTNRVERSDLFAKAALPVLDSQRFVEGVDARFTYLFACPWKFLPATAYISVVYSTHIHSDTE